MNCNAARAFLTQVNDRLPNAEPINQIPSPDLDYLSANGYVLKATKEEYNKGVEDVSRLSELVLQVKEGRVEEEQAETTLRKDEQKEHSILFHLEKEEEKEALRERIKSETDVVSKEEGELSAMGANVNSLIQKKSMMDRMVSYSDGYICLTGLGIVILNDLTVRNYRIADLEFPNFIAEIKSTYAELRSIADKAAYFVNRFAPQVPETGEEVGHPRTTLVWGTAIGLAKLQGDPNQVGERFAQALALLKDFHSTPSSLLMAGEVITAVSGQEVKGLEEAMNDLDHRLRKQGVPKELSAGVAATMIAGRRYDGSYPLDRFTQFNRVTSSYEAASILAVMNVPYDDLSSKFNAFREKFASWGYMKSEDTEIASAFMAIGELDIGEAGGKLEYIVEQLKNYLEYPLVAGAILASIPVFEAHEVLDLMEKAVTLLAGYASGLERSELVALAVRMIHGVRNELVKEIDPTAKIAETPVQFTYPAHPGVFIWYRPVIIAHSYYHATFSGMGGFHPAHSHGVGGFAG